MGVLDVQFVKANTFNNVESISDNAIIFKLDGGVYIDNNSISPTLIANKTEKISQLENDLNFINVDALSTVALSNDYNDLDNKPIIPASITENDISNWGFTKNSGTITGIIMNGSNKGTSGVIDLGNVITAHQDISNKQDKLISGTSIKTINNISILGAGNLTVGVKPLITFNASTITVDPNKYYRLTTAQSSLNITLNTPEDDTILNEYFIEFPCNGSMNLTISPTVKWANSTAPTFESGKTYQISIVNNLAVCASFG